MNMLPIQINWYFSDDTELKHFSFHASTLLIESKSETSLRRQPTSLRSLCRRNCLRTQMSFCRGGNCLLYNFTSSTDFNPLAMLKLMSTLIFVRWSVSLIIGTDALSNTWKKHKSKKEKLHERGIFIWRQNDFSRPIAVVYFWMFSLSLDQTRKMNENDDVDKQLFQRTSIVTSHRNERDPSYCSWLFLLTRPGMLVEFFVLKIENYFWEKLEIALVANLEGTWSNVDKKGRYLNWLMRSKGTLTGSQARTLEWEAIEVAEPPVTCLLFLFSLPSSLTFTTCHACHSFHLFAMILIVTTWCSK